MLSPIDLLTQEGTGSVLTIRDKVPIRAIQALVRDEALAKLDKTMPRRAFEFGGRTDSLGTGQRWAIPTTEGMAP